MDYILPAQVARTMVTVGSAKALLPPRDILVRGMLSGALLGIATSLAFTLNLQTQKPIVGALIFPVGFVIIVLLGLELVTGNFALVPLCNWLVCLGVVMIMTSSSTLSKIVAAWLPILMFFAQGFEHSVVNMFVIPAGMMLGANVSFTQWWLWNQIPVTLGNLAGGFLLTGLPLYYMYYRQTGITIMEPEAIADKVEGQEARA